MGMEPDTAFPHLVFTSLKINLNEEQIYINVHIQNIAVILIKHTGEGPAQTYITNLMFYHFAICQDYANPSSFVTRYKNQTSKKKNNN